MEHAPLPVLFGLTLTLASCAGTPRPSAAPFSEANVAGEVTQTSVILQSRLGGTPTLVEKDIPGFPGWGRLEVSTDSAFSTPLRTGWQEASAENDFLVKARIDDLQPDTRYFYRVVAGRDSTDGRPGRIATFRTLPPASGREPFAFVMLSCMDYEKFHGWAGLEIEADWIAPATGEDLRLGYPGLETLIDLDPRFVIGNGDNVYYDRGEKAKTREEMRAKWHRLFAMPRMRGTMDRIATYWLKDDHDYRFNDADTTDVAATEPSHRLGMAMFREQLPVVDPTDPDAKTYRTYRVNDLLQIWMLEGRDYRSPNALPNGPGKTLWGAEQKEWLMRTLLESDATFKIVVSPTPIVGPDDAYKRDNHVNLDGFSHEGEEFIRWLEENGLIGQVFVMNGDRHWQYHSVHPSGLEEFGSGSFIRQNARIGREPGDPRSTDPQARIDQPYIQTHPIGGFLHVTVFPDGLTARPSILFTFYDEAGEVLYATRRYGEPLSS